MKIKALAGLALLASWVTISHAGTSSEHEFHVPLQGAIASQSRLALEAERANRAQAEKDRAMCLNETRNTGIEQRYDSANYVYGIKRGSGSPPIVKTYYWDGKVVSANDGYSSGTQMWKDSNYSGGYTTYWYKYQIKGPVKSANYDWCVQNNYPTMD
jgi:hypothetical protein